MHWRKVPAHQWPIRLPSPGVLSPDDIVRHIDDPVVIAISGQQVDRTERRSPVIVVRAIHNAIAIVVTGDIYGIQCRFHVRQIRKESALAISAVEVRRSAP